MIGTLCHACAEPLASRWHRRVCIDGVDPATALAEERDARRYCTAPGCGGGTVFGASDHGRACPACRGTGEVGEPVDAPDEPDEDALAEERQANADQAAASLAMRGGEGWE